MIVSPRVERIKNCDNILNYNFVLIKDSEVHLLTLLFAFYRNCFCGIFCSKTSAVPKSFEPISTIIGFFETGLEFSNFGLLTGSLKISLSEDEEVNSIYRLSSASDDELSLEPPLT